MGKAISRIKTAITRQNRVFVLEDDAIDQTYKEYETSALMAPSDIKYYSYDAFVMSPVDIIFPVNVHMNSRDIVKARLQLYYDGLEIQNQYDSSIVYKRYDFRSIKEWYNTRVSSYNILNVVINEGNLTEHPVLSIANGIDNNKAKVLRPNECIDSKEIDVDEDNPVEVENTSGAASPTGGCSGIVRRYTMQLLFASKRRMRCFTCDMLRHMYQYMYDIGILSERSLMTCLADIEAYRQVIYLK